MGEIRITVPMQEEERNRLKEIAEGRGISLNDLLRRLCRFAAESDGFELVKKGVDLPIYWEEIQDEKDRDSQV